MVKFYPERMMPMWREYENAATGATIHHIRQCLSAIKDCAEFYYIHKNKGDYDPEDQKICSLEYMDKLGVDRGLWDQIIEEDE